MRIGRIRPLINAYTAVAWTFVLNVHIHNYTPLRTHKCTFLCSTMSKINSSFTLLLATTGPLECVECSWNYKGIKASRLIHGQISNDKPVGFGGPRPDTEICNTVTQAHFVPAAFLPLGSVCLALWGFFCVALCLTVCKAWRSVCKLKWHGVSC